jgi:hypothetical protein
MDRSDRNGFRLAVYLRADQVPEAALAPVQPAAFPDFRAQRPVSDEIFRVYQEQLFAYDKTNLNAKVESRENSPGERVTAYLFLPSTSRPPFRTVIYFPGAAAVETQSSQDFAT